MDHRHLVFLRPPVNVGDVGIPDLPERGRRRDDVAPLPTQELTHPAHVCSLGTYACKKDPSIDRHPGVRPSGNPMIGVSGGGLGQPGADRSTVAAKVGSGARGLRAGSGSGPPGGDKTTSHEGVAAQARMRASGCARSHGRRRGGLGAAGANGEAVRRRSAVAGSEAKDRADHRTPPDPQTLSLPELRCVGPCDDARAISSRARRCRPRDPASAAAGEVTQKRRAVSGCVGGGGGVCGWRVGRGRCGAARPGRGVRGVPGWCR